MRQIISTLWQEAQAAHQAGEHRRARDLAAELYSRLQTARLDRRSGAIGEREQDREVAVWCSSIVEKQSA
jgi:hypothetical protein